jgi:hypothetical protein
LTEAEFWDNIKGLQPQIYFIGISYQQVCDINRKYLSLVLLYQQVYYFRLVMRLIYLLYSLELRLLLIRCFLSIGFKYCTLVFFKEKSLCQKWKSRVSWGYNVSLSWVGLESSRHTGSIQVLPNMMPSMLLITMNLLCTLALSPWSSKHAQDTKEQVLDLDADFIPLI